MVATKLFSPTHSSIVEVSTEYRNRDFITLKEAYEDFNSKIEVDPLIKIPLIIKAIENPKSPIRLSGAVSLFHHDLIHCILGRGTSSTDEAFVIGMTMGSVPSLKKYEIALYKFIGRYLFPGIYKFSKDDLIVYSEGVKLAQSMPSLKPLDAFNPDQFLSKTLRRVREELGVDMNRIPFTF